MLRLFNQLVVRYLWRHKLIALLDLLSVAIGVSVYLAIQTANHSANRAFESSIDVIAGKTHLEVRGVIDGVDEILLFKLASDPDIRAVTPMIEGFATLPEFPGRYLHIVGVDFFTNAEFQTVGTAVQLTPDFDLEAWLGKPGHLALHSDLVKAIGGQQLLKAEIDGRRVELEIAGVISGEIIGSESIAVMDIGWAQEILGQAGTLTSIQLLVHDPSKLSEIRDRLAADLPNDIVVQPPAQRSQQIQRMLDGFQLNITALSMVSIVVGVFLIYNTLSASVVRRRREIGILRSNGASPRQIRGVFLAEGLILGLPGIALGIPAGILLARGLVGEVAETISSHYVLVSVSDPTISSWHIVHTLIYGSVAILAGALVPAIEASRIPPLRALRPNRGATLTSFPTTRLLNVGLAVIACSVLLSWLALATGPAWLSFGAALTLVIGFSLATPWVCQKLAALASRWSPTLIRIAADNLGRSLHRGSITVAALMTAIAMTIGVSVMVGSFRKTVDTWIGHTMQAELYVMPAANEVLGFKAFLPDELIAAVREHPAVRNVETYRHSLITLGDGTSFILGVVDSPEPDQLRFVGGRDDEKFNRLFEEDVVLITEALANKLSLGEGDRMTLPTPAGEREFTIAGVYYDYTDDRGKLVVTRADYERHWGETRVHSIALWLTDPAAAGQIETQIRQEFGTDPLAIYATSELRDKVFETFDQTFAVTYVLRSIAIIVAAFGVSLSLATLVMERVREIGILRAIGSSRGQVRAIYLAEAGLMGLFASFIGIVCGLGMAMILTWVVNKAFFGWTIDFDIPWLEVLATPLWITPVAVLAGLIPASRAAGSSVHEAVRTE
ncbi:MAG: putative ABC transport system permease protein [Verrucomicrobiales bacterium]|jgi:putative ABC transport system permease protein